jgi:hypothetical protein
MLYKESEICNQPFDTLRIFNDGDCFFCCTGIIKHHIGNIFKQDFSDVWYGKKAVDFRRSLLDRTCNLCDTKKCTSIDIDKSRDLYPPYPKNIEFSYVNTCNLRCMSCRDEEVTGETSEFTNELDKNMDKFIGLCKNAENIWLNEVGEVFASPHCKHLIKAIAQTYPEIKFEFVTNGNLCTKEMLIDLGVIDKIKKITISFHAYHKQLYEKLMRNSNYDKVVDNMKVLSLLKNQNNMDLAIGSVIHSLNFKEIPYLIDFAKKQGIRWSGWRMQNWNSCQMCREIDLYSCWEKSHPDHEEFKKILTSKKVVEYTRNGDVLEPYLNKIQEEELCKNFSYKIKCLLKKLSRTSNSNG